MPTAKTPRAKPTKAATTPTPTLTALPTIGSPLAGGIYAGLITPATGAPYALVLLPDKPAKLLAWAAAGTWAKKLDATLPNRVEGALLFANARDLFELSWHWLETQYDESYAWGQGFGNGYQGYYDKKYEGRARAVRRLILQSFDASVLA